jgi:hypothetical protein
MSISLIGRLLCAAQQTYEIQLSGIAPVSPATPAPPPSTLVGWQGLVHCEVAGDDDTKISAALVGETASEIIVAYRGTEPFDSPDHERMLLDWIDDLVDPLVTAPNIPGSIHQGFSHAVNELWAWTLAQVQGLTKGKPLYVTGHSKGGAMANIGAMKFAAAGYQPYVCTFEAARSGDAAFAAGFAKAITHAVRYEFQDDIVPHVPPNAAFLALFKQLPGFDQALSTVVPSYVPVGDLHFINWQNQVVADSVLLEAQRYAHMLALIAELNAKQIIDDHSIGPGSGVANVLCPGLWPAASTA